MEQPQGYAERGVLLKAMLALAYAQPKKKISREEGFKPFPQTTSPRAAPPSTDL